MAHFAAFMPGRSPDHRPSSRLESLANFYRCVLGESDARLHQCGDSLVLVASAGDNQGFVASDEAWLVVHGVLFRTDQPDPKTDLRSLLDTFVSTGQLPSENLEGSYALACWDSRRQRGLLLTDHAAAACLYYVEGDGGLYGTTTALGLAQAMSLPLDPTGVAEYMARGTLMAPNTLYAGMRRLNVGERLDFRSDAGPAVAVHWLPYREPIAHRNRREAAAHLASVLNDRIRRFATVRSPVMTDLTGGLDSRLILLAGLFAGLNLQPVVWGKNDLPDVRIARQLAGELDLPLRHLSAEACADRRITPEVRRELTALTNGDINFHGPHHLWLLREWFGGEYRLHLSGFGGELLRYFPWGQEFFGIGQRRRANVNNLLRYRFVAGGPPPLHVFRQQQWYPNFRQHLREAIDGVCSAAPGTLTTQQCDAVYVWKMTGHAALYLAAASSRIPYVAPMLTKGVIEAAISVPWPMRLTSGLMRDMNAIFSPRAADVATAYGGTGAPLRLGNLHRFAWQTARQANHLAQKLNRVALGGRLLKSAAKRPPTFVADAYLTEEFAAFLTPETMLSRGLYRPDELRGCLEALGRSDHPRQKFILRVATLEEVCRMLAFEPDPDFLCPSIKPRSTLLAACSWPETPHPGTVEGFAAAGAVSKIPW